MSFDILEKSRAKGEKFSLYEFGPVNGLYYRYTDSEREVRRRDGSSYKPEPIARSEIVSSGSLDRAALDVMMPKTLDIADNFRAYPPDGEVALVIREFHMGDTTPAGSGEALFLETGMSLVAWSGRILSVAWDSNELKLTCEPFSTALRRSGLRRCYQYGCPHVLYGDKCRANEDFAVTQRPQYAPVDRRMEVLSVNKNKVELIAGWSTFYIPATIAGPNPNYTNPPDPQKFVGGIFEWTYYPNPSTPVRFRRTILRVDGDVLTLSGLTTGLTAGNVIPQDVVVKLGCNHLLSDCTDLHRNTIHYGGQPWIPTKNPFGSKNNYY